MKLYWRFKKDGKWTWKPVTKANVKGKLAELIPDIVQYRVEEEE